MPTVRASRAKDVVGFEITMVQHRTEAMAGERGVDEADVGIHAARKQAWCQQVLRGARKGVIGRDEVLPGGMAGAARARQECTESKAHARQDDRMDFAQQRTDLAGRRRSRPWYWWSDGSASPVLCTACFVRRPGRSFCSTIMRIGSIIMPSKNSAGHATYAPRQNGGI